MGDRAASPTDEALRALPLVALVFGTFGALENMQEEIIALVPVLLVPRRGLGVDALTSSR